MTSIPFITYNSDGHVIIRAERGVSQITFTLSPDVAEQLAADMVVKAGKARNARRAREDKADGLDGLGDR